MRRTDEGKVFIQEKWKVAEKKRKNKIYIENNEKNTKWIKLK